MNSVFIRFLFVLVLANLPKYTFSQGACGFGPGKGCPGTVYDNAFVNSDNNAATIEYDNFVSTFHSSIVRNYQGSFLVWGEQISNDGVTSVLSPIEINNVNFPNLASHEVYKAAAGSNFIDERQFFVLTSNGLYAWGDEDGVVANAITNSAVFQKINTAAISNANSFGLPSTITPAEVKMMVASIAGSLNGTLMITTCSGQVWVLSQLGNLRGNNNTGNATTWSRVETGAGVFLDNIVAARVSGSSAIALRSDGTLWTWGLGTYLGNNTASATRNRATQMTSPPGTPKMIGLTADDTNPVAYFVLMTDGNLYSLGFNANRQLGDFTTTERRGWVQPRYNAAAPSGTVMNNILWVAPSESDGRFPAANVINSDSILYAFGANDTRMIGRGAAATADPGIPDGLSATTKITGVVTGGHTTMVTTKCELNFGYVGHRIRGSMGNGSSANITENSYNFATAQVPVCGTAFSSVAIIPSVTGPGGNYCVGQLYDITVVPSGGTLTSGAGDPINLFGNSTIGYQLQFTGLGTATLTYQLPTNSCGIAPIPATISVQSEFCQSDLSVVKSVNNPNPAIGSNVIFTIVANNNGPSDNIDVVVNDLLPTGYSYLSHSVSSGAYDNTTGIWTIGALTNGSTATLTVTAQVQSSGNYLNTASIGGDLTDPSNVNNSSSVSVCALTLAVSSLTNVLCFGNATGTATATSVGGTGAMTYLWSNGQTTATATGLAATTYTVTITDANLCTSNTGVTITEPAAALVASIGGQTNVLCFGNATGTATATSVGGTGAVTYLWSNGQTTATATGLAATTYTVTITDANLCTSNTGVTITEPAAALVASIGGQTNVLCFGNATGTATATSVGGTGAVTYLWSNGQTLATATGLAATTYTVTITDANLCTSNTGVTITEPAAALVITITSTTNVFCTTLGTASINVTGGTSPYTYSWNGSASSQTTSSVTGLLNGTYIVTVSDNNGCSLTETVSIGEINCPPVANNDLVTTNEDAPLTFNPLNNDNDLNGPLDTTSLGVVNGPSNGTVTVNPITGEITYTPNLNFNGTDTLIYQICDLGTPVLCDTAIVVITVNSLNDDPIANADPSTTNEDTPITINVPSNDTDVDNNINPASVTVRSGPSNGTATVNPVTGEITYTPNQNFNGTDTLIYEICDLGSPILCDTAMVVITVNAVNDGPIANDDTNTTNEDNAVSGTVASNDSDVDGPSINITQVSGPSNGTIVLNIDGTYTYTPSLNFNGTDTLVYSYCDGGTPNLCDTAILVITVNAVNDTIIAVNDAATTNEDIAVDIFVLSNDFDLDGNIDSTSVTIITSPTNGVVTVDPVTGTVTYTPNPGYNGVDFFVYQICDNGIPLPGLCDQAAVVITVNPINDSPIANPDLANTNEDSPVVIDVISNDTDSDGNIDPTTVNVISGPNNGIVVVDSVTGEITYTPNTNFNGSDTLVYVVCDNGTPLPALCDTAVVIININPVNDSIIANPDIVSTNEDTSVIISILSNDNDLDGSIDSSSVSIVSNPTNGTVVYDPITGTVTYTPNIGFNGLDSFVYIVCDNGSPLPATCDTAIVVINVAPCLSLPFADCDGDGVTNADEATDGTDPTEPCEYTASSVSLTPSAAWLALDCDSDGVINGTELADSTNPQDPCSYDSISITLAQGAAWNDADCDGDGVSNGTEVIDGTNPNDPCSNLLSSVSLPQGGLWNDADCDGDGVTNGTEVLDGTDPNDPCSYFDVSVTFSQSGDWTGSDCDGDGVTNGTEVNDGTNPFDPCSLVLTSQTLSPDSTWNNSDCDNDGFTNSEEVLDGSNPLDSCSPIACDLNIPEGFSPNGDGTNDTYVIRAIERYPNNNIKIFNRWGNIVYETDAYLNQWDGRSNRGLRLGEELPSGVYFIILDLGEGGKPYKGNVYLNREN